MANPPTLEQFARQVAAATNDSWLSSFVTAIKQRTPGHPDAALFLCQDDTLKVVASTGEVPAIPEKLPEQPYRDGEALWLPLLDRQSSVLWIKRDGAPDKVRAELEGWLAVASIGLNCRYQGEQLEKQRVARDHFFSMVNHDLKSPLASIKAMADLVVRKVQRGTLDPRSEEGVNDLMERLAFLSRRVKDLATLIDVIGDVSNIERGRLTLNVRPLNMATVVQGAVERIEAETGRKVRYEQKTDETMVRGDATRFAQLLHILLKNAVDYSEPGSEIDVRLRPAADSIKVEIKDRGRGIEAEKQARLFREYGRIVQQAPSGLGVGLYIASALVKAHQGHLELDSTVGQGTTVQLTIPVEQPPKKESNRQGDTTAAKEGRADTMALPSNSR